ncbi:hypothetical protein GQ42DRAFT_165366 [Ramicandelaber brevisporus]|nr:hypothetical protein GQ42DRAFT_165366 [Ramicandelaber brevisporus]
MAGKIAVFFRRIRADISNQEIYRLVIALVYLFVVTFFMTSMQILSDRRWNPEEYHTLRDLMFEVLPWVSNVNIADGLVISFLAISLVGVIISCRSWRARVIFLRRGFWIIGTLYFFRAFTMIVTLLPPPFPCVPPTANTAGEFIALALKLFTGVEKTCTDAIYSGHTMLLVTCFLFWRMYARHWVFILYALLHSFTGVLMISMTHLHYTTDILLAIIISYSFVGLYFYGVERAILYRLQALPYKHKSLLSKIRDATHSRKARSSTSGPVTDQTSSNTAATLPVSSSNQGTSTARDNSGGNANVRRPVVDQTSFMTVLAANRVLNNGVPRLIGWMDGVDLRWPGLGMNGDDDDFLVEDVDEHISSSPAAAAVLNPDYQGLLQEHATSTSSTSLGRKRKTNQNQNDDEDDEEAGHVSIQMTEIEQQAPSSAIGSRSANTPINRRSPSSAGHQHDSLDQDGTSITP